jgi:hypothetical protein
MKYFSCGGLGLETCPHCAGDGECSYCKGEGKRPRLLYTGLGACPFRASFFIVSRSERYMS